MYTHVSIAYKNTRTLTGDDDFSVRLAKLNEYAPLTATLISGITLHSNHHDSAPKQHHTASHRITQHHTAPHSITQHHTSSYLLPYATCQSF
jgi:hypothetical protein